MFLILYMIHKERFNMSNIVTTVLSIIGAAAWLPVIFSPIINLFRKIQITLLDSRILTNAVGMSVGMKEKKNGTLLMLVLNIYINKLTIFAKNISAIVILKNGTKLKTELLDFSTLISHNDNKTNSTFSIDREVEFNISRTIYANVDNVKYVAFLVESRNFSSIDDIEKIEICLKIGKYFSKKSTITKDEFPKFNSTHLIEKCEIVIPHN